MAYRRGSHVSVVVVAQVVEKMSGGAFFAGGIFNMFSDLD